MKIPDIIKRPRPSVTPPPPPVTPPTPSNPSTPGRRPTPRPSLAEVPSNEFGKTLESLLGNKFGKSSVSEEEIYAALIFHQLKTTFGKQFAKDWKSTFELSSLDKPMSERRPSAERAANDALKFFVESTLITKDQAKEIKQTAFELAQLDKNKDALWDDTGGGTDKTIAVKSFAKVQDLVQTRLDNLNSISSKRGKGQSKKVSAVG